VDDHRDPRLVEGGGVVDHLSSQHPVETPSWALHRLRDMGPRRARRSVSSALARALAAAVVLLVAYALMPLAVLSDVELIGRVALVGGLVAVVVWVEVRAVARAELPELRAVEALTVTVTVVVIAFAAGYLNLSSRDPEAFNERLGRTSSLYFTMTTLATIGFGDIHPVSQQARLGVMAQIVANVVVLGAAVRLIIGLARHRVVTDRRAVR
jgi:hypothetical protein